MAKKKQIKPRKYAPRQTRKFQLRLDHADDAHVREVLDFCKGQRREVTVIRAAITLYWALEQGDLEALFGAFPQYKAQFAPSTAEALEQFMEILRQQQQPVAIGAGQSTTYNPPIPLPALPAAEVKPSVPVSDDVLFDNFLSVFQ